jgi:eukaryotic-like serine/threonine-protein kinase
MRGGAGTFLWMSEPELIASRYRLLRPLGQGGMGRVWLARDEVLHRDVAIKELVPPPGLTMDERREMRERSLREARAIARLNNINVVRVFDVLRTDGDPWIVMEYVASSSLQDILSSTGPVPPTRGIEIGLGMLNALRAAHRAGVVHRDVKPGNVLIGEDGRVVLTDFGLATVPGDPNVTRTGLVLGSPAYIAPERARDGTAGPQADLWSLGATLYAAVEGQSPYARPSAIGTLAALATEPPPAARNAGPLRPVLTGLLRKDPTERLSAEEAERMLMRAAGRKSRAPLNLWQTPRRATGAAGTRQSDTQSTPSVPAPRPPLTPGQRTSIAPATGSHPPIFSKGRAAAAENPAEKKKQPLDATRLDGTPVADRDATTRIDPRALAETPQQDTTTRITGGHLLGGRDATTRIDVQPSRSKGTGAAGTPLPVTPGSDAAGRGSQSIASGGAPQATSPDETTVVSPAVPGADASRPGSTKPGSAEPDAADPGAAGVATSGSATSPSTGNRDNPRTNLPGTGPGATGSFPVISGLGAVTSGTAIELAPEPRGATDGGEAPAAAEATPGSVTGGEQAPAETGDVETQAGTPETPGEDVDGTTVIAPASPATPGAADARTPDASDGSEKLDGSDWARDAWARTSPDESDATAVVPQTPANRAAKPGGRKALGAPLARFARSAPREEDYDDRTQVVAPARSGGYDDYDTPKPASRGASDPRVWLVALLVVAVVVAAFLIVPRLFGDDRDDQGSPEPTPSQSAAPSSAPLPRPSGTPGPGVPALTMPAGWHTYTSSAGWTVPVQDDWSVFDGGTHVEFRENDGGGRLMLITALSNPGQDAKVAITQAEQSRRGEWEQYSLIRIEKVDYFDSGADWEFAYGPQGNYRNHVLIRNFVTTKDLGYQIYWGTPDNVWEENLAQFNLIVALFKPTKD